MTKKKRTTMKQARRVGDKIGVDWDRFDLEQFRSGMDVEFEHGAHDPQTDVTGDEPILTGKIALAHMKEFPDYYERLGRMEKEAEREWARRRRANLLMWLLALRGIARGVIGGWLARRQYLKEAPQAWYQRSFFSEYRVAASWLAPVALITGLLLSVIFLYRRRFRKAAKTQEENKAVFRRYVEEVGNEGNLELAEEIFDRYQAHQADGSVLERGPEDVKRFMGEFREGFPDFHSTIEDMVAEGDKVVTRWTMRGTHRGEFRGIAPTGKQIAVTGIGIFRFSPEGKVVESWDNFDQLGMMRQLGALPE